LTVTSFAPTIEISTSLGMVIALLPIRDMI
jgi:hypothetical protein